MRLWVQDRSHLAVWCWSRVFSIPSLFVWSVQRDPIILQKVLFLWNTPNPNPGPSMWVQDRSHLKSWCRPRAVSIRSLFLPRQTEISPHLKRWSGAYRSIFCRRIDFQMLALRDSVWSKCEKAWQRIMSLWVTNHFQWGEKMSTTILFTMKITIALNTFLLLLFCPDQFTE